MGIDGFSMSNLGMHRNKTSAQLSHDAETVARETLEHQMPDVDGVGKREKAGKKDDEAAFNGTIPFIPDGKKKKNKEDETQDESNDSESLLEGIDEDDEEDDSKYRFLLGSDEMIEIRDNTDNSLIKKISIEQAQKAVGCLDDLPGFLVNKEV